ncbi:hypothetical protein [Agromyces salentinus]|uniref:DUF222 domain-containing protein n=1 Tax=Agromyces salentinus TaxID=269421 RepID=A0ABP4Z5P9_9MICO|nr:hypothetical protein [Agromyces salentinus]
MTLEHTISQLRAQASQRIVTFAQTLDSVRTDRMLSDDGKRDRIAREYVATRIHIDKLRTREADALLSRRVELERLLFGWEPTDDAAVLSARRESNELADALDDPRDALLAYQRAKRRSDEMHVHAIFARALELGWSSIIDDYLVEHPERAAGSTELAAILRANDDVELLTAVMHYAMSQPSELSHVDLAPYEHEARAGAADVEAAFARQLSAV